MDELNYREVVQTILKSHAINRPNIQTEVQLIFDTERDSEALLRQRSEALGVSADRYQVLNIGWQDLTRVFGCIIHVEIKDGKIWIERDGTEIGVANELVAAEVPKQDIVLGFKAPYKRKFTEFAAG